MAESQMKMFAVRAAVIIAATSIFVGLMYYRSNNPPPTPKPSEKTSTPTDFDAWVACQLAVTKSLKSPSTVDFGNQSPRDTVDYIGDSKYQVKGWADSKNAWGASTRTTFTGTMIFNSSGLWDNDLHFDSDLP